MKYIRTKDGIYETLTQNLYKNDDLLYIDGYGLERVIKTADTIEKLCDEYVVIGFKIKEPFIFSKEGISINDFWKHSPSDTIVYGAIWCEFGLKYVAKMNEKGVLELL